MAMRRRHIVDFYLNTSILIYLVILISLPRNIQSLNYRPTFKSAMIIKSVLEDAALGTSITNLADYAQDDEGDVITYSLDTVGQSYCNVDSVSGLVTLKKALDREINKLVEFTAYAEDSYEGGGPQRRGRTKVFIYVLDVNEWPPEFQGTPYTATVLENATIGQSVLTVRTTDKDDGSNAEVSFQFKTGTQIPQFSIDASSGELKVAGPLDYETSSRYTLSVVAKDKGTPQFSSETRVIVDIQDVGDTAPKFTPSSSYEARVNENLPINSKITKVTASDGDVGVNNQIAYAIFSGNLHGLFSIDISTGDIRANGTLDREKASAYNLKIKAYEVPMPSSFAYADVVIQIDDVNDYRPAFDQSVYSFEVDEDKPKGFIISQQLKAIDNDATVTNSAFQYSLTGDSSKFAISLSSGQLTVNEALDYETQSQFIFTVLATETLSSEKLSGNATVNITLKNVNDNKPIFNKTNYLFQIKENSLSGAKVGYVLATDADKGIFGKVTYSLTSSSSSTSALFAINSTSGEIQLQGIPDYESTQAHTFQAVATDGGGSNAQSTSVTVTVDILDVNDNDPVFTNLPATISVPEHQPAGTVFTVKATDSDSGINSQISVQLLNSSVPEFSFSPQTGILNTTKPLDYESKIKIFRLAFIVSDHGQPARNSTQMLQLNVQDKNDHTPTFSHPVYNASIREDAKIGSVVINLNATDADSTLNGKVTYEILNGNGRNTFAITATTGEIRTQDLLDRETTSAYELQVKAKDHGIPSLSTTTKVIINITDYNDNFPNFLQSSYSVKVNESTAVGTSILHLQTDDKDIGENGRVSYFIVSGNGQGDFKLMNQTGQLFVEKSLDWETTTTYILNIKAEDHGIPKKIRNAFVTIDVIDNNDNAPVFDENDYSFQIFENVPLGRSVGRVVAEDKDGKLPPNGNGVIKYSITAGNRGGAFKIDENVGIITTNGTIDRETTSHYNLTVTATDGGLPQNSASVFVFVRVLDENDNPPVFTKENYTVQILENIRIGSLVIQVKAIDTDDGLNAKISYSITAGNEANKFTINSDGNITVDRNVDRETVPEYKLRILAQDTGSPQKSSSVDMMITLLDINDNDPIFAGTPYKVNVLEEQPSGLNVIQVTAKDADLGQNSAITYNIISSSPSNKFTINSTNGNITTTARLDREINAVYYLNVSAADQSKEQRRSFTIVIVTVVDINDHVPVIQNLPNSTSVSEDVNVGSSVFEVVVVDLDSADNSRLSYSIVSGDGGKFSINGGKIATKASLDREIDDSFTLVINVTDHGHPALQASSALTITVTDVNDNTPKFHPDPTTNSASYTMTIPEGYASVNSTVFDANATDPDSGTNGQIVYTISNGNSDRYFRINADTGEIKVIRLIDREASDITRNVAGLGVFTLTVRASDQSQNNKRSATATVTIMVSDVNDNPPRFSKQGYIAGVTEGADVSTAVITLTATDPDLGLNSRVKYKIISGNERGDFAIVNQHVGTITVAKLLNAEEQSIYNLTVMAEDDGGTLKDGTSLNSTVLVQIQIGDLNDNDPVFNQSVYLTNIEENVIGTKLVTRVLATDADQGSNGEVWYQITSGNIGGVFSVDKKTGDVFAVKPLDREKVSRYSLAIKAEDKGTPSSRKAAAEVIIYVKDVNDNPTLFTTSIYVGHIAENSAPGTQVIVSPTISFSDADKEANAKISLSLSGTGYDRFMINSTSYKITSAPNKTLDRESTDFYYLKINLEDTDGLSSSANLIIVVDDVNDNSPIFNESRVNVTISEDASIGYSLPRLKAHDNDTGANADVSYAIRGGDGKFVYDKASGSVQLGNKLDREVQDFYRLILIALDQGKPPLEGQAIINVYVSDVIDSPPYFEPSSVEIQVNETLPVDSIIYTLQAKDADLNDLITYRVTSSTAKGEIELNSTTGHLRLVKSLDRENATNFQMSLQATDSNSLSSSTNGFSLKITVLDANDNAPKFQQPYYQNDVVENTPEGSIVMPVLAVDPDEGSNGKITYSIQGDVSGLIKIDPEKGFISKHGVWKTSSGSFLNFTVIAKDRGNPPRSGTVKCTIRWVTVNSVNPQFNQSLYSVSLSESATSGNEVIKMTAYKRGKLEAVTYTITGAQGSFSIDGSTGIIRVAKGLDREQQERYAITVTATDNQSPPQTGVTSVIITLLDVNDNRPQFQSDAYRFSVSEDIAAFSVIGNVVAVDSDAANNSTVSYSILSGNERKWFLINPQNGSIVSTQLLDREIQEEIKLVVKAEDQGIKPLSSNVTVVISLLDINDNTPTFDKTIYNISVDENIPGDSQVVTVLAVDEDKDQNGAVSYSIVSGNDLGHFYIGKTTGSINIAKLLDHESKHTFNLTILATDNGLPSKHSSTVLVLIQVIDVNDNKPRFLSPSYSFSVEENVIIGHQIGQVVAVDTDTRFNIVYYSIKKSFSSSTFQISETNGTIYLASKVDREIKDQYILTVQAYNKDKTGNSSQRSSVEVLIQVIDVNDNYPTFPPSCCNASVSENAFIGDIVLRVIATDSDSGGNQHLTYSIVAGNDQGDFKIDSTNGDIKVRETLDRERKNSYALVINAKDGGVPSLSANTTIYVRILDVNDMKPVFQLFNVSAIPEDSAIGTTVVKVRAVDNDEGKNGEIKYEILSGNDERSFTLSSITGELKLAKKLDFERTQSYKIRIIARDNGSPSLSSFTTVDVRITNINDNIPTFAAADVLVSVSENLAAGSSVTIISASDSDNDAIYYYLKGTQQDAFEINERTGLITTNKVLDRETVQVYTLTVEATNIQKGNGVTRKKRATTSADKNAIPNSLSTQKITIEVADLNDNPPKFTQNEYLGGVSENAKYGTSIIQVVAVDVDAGNNSNIAYTLIDEKNGNIFTVEKSTGWVRSAQSFTGKVGQSYNLKVLAQDNGGTQPNFNDTTMVKIFVLTDKQRVVLTMKVNPQLVRDNKEEFIRFLQNITSFRINIDDIQYSTKNGAYDTTSTDLTFHAVDTTTNEIQDRDVVIRAIVRNEAQYQPFFDKWKVQSVKAVITPTAAPLQDDTQAILIGVAAALFLIIVGFIFALCHLRKKQRRKLKAATASSKDADATMELEHMEQLHHIVKGSVSGKRSEGSQMSKAMSRTSERFYPMWIEPTDDNFDSARPLMTSFRIKRSSASYYEENKSMNTISNTKTLTTEIIMMSDPYLDETDVDFYNDGETFDGETFGTSEDVSDMFDSQTDDLDAEVQSEPPAPLVLSREELLLRASIQPLATLELEGVNVTSI